MSLPLGTPVGDGSMCVGDRVEPAHWFPIRKGQQRKRGTVVGDHESASSSQVFVVWDGDDKVTRHHYSNLAKIGLIEKIGELDA